MNVDYKAIGKRVREIRVSKNLSQEKLAELAVLSSPHMSHVETGNTKVSLATVVRIANALEVSVDDLLCDNVVKSKHIFEKEIQNLLSDCSDTEIRAITEIIKASKSAIRMVKTD